MCCPKGKCGCQYFIIWGRCNLKRSRRTVIFLPVYKISSLKITPPKTPKSGQFSYPLPNNVSFLFRLEFRFRSRDFSFYLFPVWQPYCWRFWSVIVPIHTSTINAPELRERINFKKKIMDTGVLDFFNKKINPGLFLLKVRSCVFISNFHHSPPPPPKGYKIVSLIIN
jgi:hypothetical protein